jgi:CBS domain-containing protein
MAAGRRQEDRMRIEQLTSTTSARLMTVRVDATLQTAALSFSKPGVGLVVVCHGNGEATGVLSKSDLVRHLADPYPEQRTVAALMSRHIISCHPDDDVHSVWQIMTAQALQNMPVLGDGRRPLGILDIRDAMRALFEQEEFQERLLANYIAGIGYQ